MIISICKSFMVGKFCGLCSSIGNCKIFLMGFGYTRLKSNSESFPANNSSILQSFPPRTICNVAMVFALAINYFVFT